MKLKGVQRPFLLVGLLRRLSSGLDSIWTKLSSLPSLLRQAWEQLKIKKSEAKPKAGSERDKREQKHRRTDITLPPLSALPNTDGEGKAERTDKTRKYREYVLWPFVAIWRLFKRGAKFLDEHHGGVTALATLAIVVLTIYYVKYSKKQWEISRDTLQISQRAYVTIGKKDGVVADFIVPSDKTQDAEIVIYFQNSGHVPAKFAWGTMAGFLGAGSMKKSPGIIFVHPYKGFSRTRDIKTGSIGEQGESALIAGDSVFVSTLGSISQQNLAELRPNTISELILGMFLYCDEVGTNSLRSFALRYRSNAASTGLSFDLAEDYPMHVMPLPQRTLTTEYLPPCELRSENTK